MHTVTGTYCREHLRHEVCCEAFTKMVALLRSEEVEEFAAFGQLHDQEYVPLRIKDLPKWSPD